jgi:integrase/recombinase XerD
MAGGGDEVTDFVRHASDYLQLRRSLGFKLELHGRVLPRFAEYLEAAGTSTLTTEHALAWAGLPPDVPAISASQRLGVVRGFARYLCAFDPATEVPPLGILTSGSRRRPPHILTQDEVSRLLAAARDLMPALRAANYEALLGLLAVSGMRVGEALQLSRDNVDLVEGVITVQCGKFNRSRLIPLHRTATRALQNYAESRDQLCPRPRTQTFFVSHSGSRLYYGQVCRTFHELAVTTGVRSNAAWPRIHDLRHSFAVHTLLDLQRSGNDIHANMGTLSLYLGHVKPAGTYWYLTAVPELMELAVSRLERCFGDGR